MPSFPDFGPSSPFYNWAETDPEGQRASYFSHQDQFGSSPNKKKWFEGQFQRVQDTYAGQGLAYLMGGGQNPQSRNDFYGEFFAPGGGAQQQWQAMSPNARGMQDSRFAPAARWNF